MSAALARVESALAAPVPGPDPAGADVTYEPAFERLRQTVDRLGSVGTAVDHESAAGGEGPFADGADAVGAGHAEVVDGALAVLAEQSKDLRAAAYLVASLAHTDRAAGVAAGLRGLVGMVQAHWAGLHPQRPRARRAAFEFLTHRVGTAVSTWDAPGREEGAAVDAALTALSDLQLLVSSEMGDQAPALSGLRRALSERRRRVPSEPPPAPDPASAAQGDGAADVAAAEPTPATPTAVASPTATTAPAAAVPAPGVSASPEGDPVRAVVQAAAALRDGSPGSAAAVRLLRVVRWDALAAPPPSTDGATRIEAPPARRREALVALAASDPALFAEQAEQAFAAPPFHFWLDLQRLADGALAALGASAADARRALRAEAAHLVGRLPALLDLQFRDGTPFADPATRAWALGLAPAAPASHAVADGDDPFEDARALAGSGDLPAALAALPPAPGGRAGFVHRLRTAELCLTAGHAEVALAVLAALGRLAADRDLDGWEPGLAADLYAAQAQAARQSDDAGGTAAAQARLAAVAPARALP